MRKLIMITYLLLNMHAYQSQNGEEVFQFMNIPASARQVALGGYLASVYDKDPNLALTNPSIMNEEMHMQLGTNYTAYLTDITFGSANYVHQIGDYHFLSLGGRYLDYGSFDGYDEAGVYTEEFTAKDAALTLGYAYEVNEFFTVGANASYVSSKIESYTSSAILADVAVTFHDYDYYNNVSLQIRNVGFLIDQYESTKEKMPVQVNLSYSWIPENVPIQLSLMAHDLQEWNIASPVNVTNGQETGFGQELLSHFALGAEFFPEKGFNLRFGYNFKRGSELAVQEARSLAGLTFGFGLRISKFNLEYAHARYHNASNVNSFGLRLDLGRLINPRYY